MTCIFFPNFNLTINFLQNKDLHQKSWRSNVRRIWSSRKLFSERLLLLVVKSDLFFCWVKQKWYCVHFDNRLWMPWAFLHCFCWICRTLNTQTDSNGFGKCFCCCYFLSPFSRWKTSNYSIRNYSKLTLIFHSDIKSRDMGRKSHLIGKESSYWRTFIRFKSKLVLIWLSLLIVSWIRRVMYDCDYVEQLIFISDVRWNQALYLSSLQ